MMLSFPAPYLTWAKWLSALRPAYASWANASFLLVRDRGHIGNPEANANRMAPTPPVVVSAGHRVRPLNSRATPPVETTSVLIPGHEAPGIGPNRTDSMRNPGSGIRFDVTLVP